MTNVKYAYRFFFQDGSHKQFDLSLNPESYEVERHEKATPPEWTKLDFCKCTNCPLKSETTPFCPVAINLSDLVAFFSDHLSYEKVGIQVESANRNYSKKTDLQDGIQSIYGLIMATSGCPHMNFLKPMAYFHLPFSQFNETVTRTVSIYLLSQHYNQKKGLNKDVSLENLRQHYAQVNQVNQGIANRFKGIKIKDSSKNGIVILDAFATMVPWELDKDYEGFKFLFEFKNSHNL